MAMLGHPVRLGRGGPRRVRLFGARAVGLRHAGITLPRTAQLQYDAGPRRTTGTQLQPGDLLFFGDGPKAIPHVGIFIGDGLMVDAPHTGAVVRLDRLAGFTPAYFGASATGNGK